MGEGANGMGGKERKVRVTDKEGSGMLTDSEGNGVGVIERNVKGN